MSVELFFIIGKTIWHCRIVEKLRAGGIDEVYEAVDTRHSEV